MLYCRCSQRRGLKLCHSRWRTYHQTPTGTNPAMNFYFRSIDIYILRAEQVLQQGAAAAHKASCTSTTTTTTIWRLTLAVWTGGAVDHVLSFRTLVSE